ncbi:MAG TPA: beta-ketoacyl synthase N-terminal-like domain-containing protein, partial [Magnetovibrio sp.]
QQAIRIFAHMEAEPPTGNTLADIAYTLQVGRAALGERLAFVAANAQEAMHTLKAVIDRAPADVMGGSRSLDELEQSDGADDALSVSVRRWAAEGKLHRVAELWVKGVVFDWLALYESWAARRVSLPTYPFAEERYWIDEGMPSSQTNSSSALHPLVHRNISDVRGIRFATYLSGNESFLTDHRVNGAPVLPAAVIIEMMRAAANLADSTHDGSFVLSDIALERPVIVRSQTTLNISVTVERQGALSLVLSDGDGERYATASAMVETLTHDRLDIAALRAQLDRSVSNEDVYCAMRAEGVEHGPAMQALGVLSVSADGVLAEVLKPTADAISDSSMMLDPVMLDGALQAGMALLLDTDGRIKSGGGVPVAVARVETHAPLPPRLLAWLQPHADGMNVVLCASDGTVLARFIGVQTAEGNRKEQTLSEKITTTVSKDASEAMLLHLRKLVGATLKLSPEDIDPKQALESYGLDSVMVLRLTARLEETMGTLPKTLFFEYRCLEDLAARLAADHPEIAVRLAGASSAAPSTAKEASLAATVRPRAAQSESEAVVAPDEPIAIIGLAGRYPQAPDLQTFWTNLRSGKDSVVEIPHERWDASRFYSSTRELGKTRCLRGGFLEGVDRFDAAFFNMLPTDAELSDPQERLFLETVHHALEDSGYTRKSLSKNGAVGLFVGVMYEDYQLYGVEETLRGNPTALSGSPASVANRASYFFGFRGPSMAVDTMCSSSLSALHLACQALRSKDCATAVAGGVNLTLHPNKYLMLGRGGFESARGHCAAFGADGDGYVPAEGVGAVVLKPLSHALRDGDAIHGVILASAINHGGKTNGYTVPDPAAQAEVVSTALGRA